MRVATENRPASPTSLVTTDIAWDAPVRQHTPARVALRHTAAEFHKNGGEVEPPHRQFQRGGCIV